MACELDSTKSTCILPGRGSTRVLAGSPQTALRLVRDAFVQRRAKLAALLAPAHGSLGPEARGPQIIDLLLRHAAVANPLLCALSFIAGQ